MTTFLAPLMAAKERVSDCHELRSYHSLGVGRCFARMDALRRSRFSRRRAVTQLRPDIDNVAPRNSLHGPIVEERGPASAFMTNALNKADAYDGRTVHSDEIVRTELISDLLHRRVQHPASLARMDEH